MRIGLIDVDGHNFPNLALMRISAYHKQRGDTVEWWWSDFIHYDIVYMSRVFNDTYSQDIPAPMNADKVIKGGSGYAIVTENGKEIFYKDRDKDLPSEIESCFPDYSIYPHYNYAVSMTSRGCPNCCAFCHVWKKEGKCSVKVADVSDFWNKETGKKEIKVLDPNITACLQKRDLMNQYAETGVYIDFTQGVDIKLIDEADIEDINRMKIKEIHFAWDIPEKDLKSKFELYAKKAKHKPHGKYGTVYCLTNFHSTMEQNLYRIYTLRDLGFDPYVMIYNKPSAPKEIRDLQRWCNSKYIFRSVPDFRNYQKNKVVEDDNNFKIIF